MKALTIMWVLFCNLGGLLSWSKLGETRKSAVKVHKRGWQPRKSVRNSRKSAPNPRKYYVNYS